MFVRHSLHLLVAAAVALPVMSAAQSAPPSGPARRNADAALVRALQSNTWTLQSATEPSGQPVEGLLVPGHAFVMRMQDARVSIQGGCNSMNGGWRLSPPGRPKGADRTAPPEGRPVAPPHQLTIGRLAATMKACDAPLMQADAALSALLAQPLDVALRSGDKPELRLVSPTRQTLVFSGQPTFESLYGKATRMFLEVAPQTVECVSGVMRGQCLQVRERRFDQHGLRIEPPGAWRVFHGGIDGYTHQADVRNVLRIDRYQRRHVPADASRYVYVLDMVVESEQVKN